METQAPKRNRTPIIRQVTPITFQRLTAFKDELNLSSSDLAHQLGCSDGHVRKYLSNQFVGDIERFESKVEDIIRTAPLRKLVEIETWDNRISRSVTGTIKSIIRTSGIGGVRGPAGIGKSIGGRRWAGSHPTTLFITLLEGCCNAHYIEKCVFEVTKTKGFETSKMNRSQWNLSKLRGSDRLIIIDNAHKLTSSGRKLLFDWNDEGGIPVFMISNEEIIIKIKENDQQLSRVGIFPFLELTKNDIETETPQILRSICPEHKDALLDYSLKVASNKGHFRSLRMQLSLAMSFMEGGIKDPREAFRAAHNKLIRNYSL